MKNMNFEDAMTRLDAEVRKLESGNMSLEESIASFEEAVKLVRVCNEKLESAQRRVRILTETANGEVTDMPFDMNNET
jgi:exodeoxyribonuclease VII small subunit